jgi:hypothetical protein
MGSEDLEDRADQPGSVLMAGVVMVMTVGTISVAPGVRMPAPVRLVERMRVVRIVVRVSVLHAGAC